MNRVTLLEALVQEYPYIKRETLRACLQVLFREMEEGIVQDKRVLLTRFGMFKTYMRKAVKSNFKENPIDHIPREYVKNIKFKPAKELLKRIKNG